jgi:hypothetical protein
MTVRMTRLGALTISWCLAAAAGSALTIGAAALLGGRSGGSMASVGDGWVEKAMADVGKGDYFFLANRLSMWVINRSNGRLIHYEIKDNSMGTVVSSHVGQLNLEWFPMRDTDFLGSDRNLTPYLWVVNRVTGNFQVWRVYRDVNLITDQFPVPVGEDMQAEPTPPMLREDRGGVSPMHRLPPAPEEPAAEPAKKRTDSRAKSPRNG